MSKVSCGLGSIWRGCAGAVLLGLCGCFRLTGFCASDGDCPVGLTCQARTSECQVSDGGAGDGPARDGLGAPAADLADLSAAVSDLQSPGQDLSRADLTTSSGALVAYLFPRPQDDQQRLAIPVNTVLATVPGGRTVRYTLDGSDPRLAPLQASPAALGLLPRTGNQVEVRWLAQEGTAQGAADRLTLRMDPQGQRDMNVVVENLQLGAGPVAVVAPRTTLQASFDYLAWPSQASGVCPGCIIQMVLLVDDKNVYCREGIEAQPPYTGPRPRLRDSFTLVAPAAPGEYPVLAGFTLEFSCTTAKTKPARNAYEVGRIIVR